MVKLIVLCAGIITCVCMAGIRLPFWCRVKQGLLKVRIPYYFPV